MNSEVENLKYTVAHFVNNCSVYELMTRLDKYIIKEIYGRGKMMAGYNLGNLSEDITNQSLTPKQIQNLKIVSNNLGLSTTTLPTFEELNEAIWGYREIRVNIVHKNYQYNLDRNQYYQMSDEICQRGGVDIDDWKIKGRAIIDLTFKALGDKPFDKKL